MRGVAVKLEYGLSKETLSRIRGVLSEFPAVEKAVLYGSRAKGTYKPGSDIDLTLFGHLDQQMLGRIDDALDNLLLPHRFDLSLFSKITHADLIDHIDRVGVAVYDKNTADL